MAEQFFLFFCSVDTLRTTLLFTFMRCSTFMRLLLPENGTDLLDFPVILNDPDPACSSHPVMLKCNDIPHVNC